MATIDDAITVPGSYIRAQIQLHESPAHNLLLVDHFYHTGEKGYVPKLGGTSSYELTTSRHDLQSFVYRPYPSFSKEIGTFQILTKEGEIDPKAADNLQELVKSAGIKGIETQKRLLFNAVANAVHCNPHYHQSTIERIGEQNGAQTQFKTTDYWNTKSLAQRADTLNALAGGQVVFDKNNLKTTTVSHYPVAMEIGATATEPAQLPAETRIRAAGADGSVLLLSQVAALGASEQSQGDSTSAASLGASHRTKDPAARTAGALGSGDRNGASTGNTVDTEPRRRAGGRVG